MTTGRDFTKPASSEEEKIIRESTDPTKMILALKDLQGRGDDNVPPMAQPTQPALDEGSLYSEILIFGNDKLEIMADTPQGLAEKVARIKRAYGR